MQGMRSFVRAHRGELDRSSTYVLNLDSVGAGDIRFEVGEGPAVTYELGSRLTELCAAIADADADGPNAFRAAPLRHGFATDAKSLEKTGAVVTEAIEPEALDRAHGFALELIRRLDADVGRRAGTGPKPKRARLRRASAGASER